MPQQESLEIRRFRQAAGGDPQAFHDIFRQYFQPVYNYALSLTNDPATAEDVTQEAFIRAHANLDRFGPPWNFRTWIFRLTRNIYIDLARKEKIVVPLEDSIPYPTSGPAIEDQVIVKEIADRVRTTLQNLSPQNREALVLREVHALSYAEIAEVMETTPAYVKTLLHRARTSFQEAYGIRLLIEEPTEFCAEVSSLLHILQDGEELGSQEQFVKQHLKECEACQERRRWLVVQAGLFGALVPIPPPTGLETRILEQTGVAKRLRRRHRNRRLRRFYRIGGVAVLAGLAGWTIFSGWGGGRDHDRVPQSSPTVPPGETAPSVMPTQPRGTAVGSGALSASQTPTAIPFSGEAPPTTKADSLCWQGPGGSYEIISSIDSGTQVELLGVGAQDGWLVIDNPRYKIPCWLMADNLELDPDLDLSALTIFPVPPLPTPTATPVPVLTAPTAPTSLAANETACNTTDGYVVKLTWKDNAHNEAGYRVYRNMQLIATLGPNASQYTDNPPGSGPYSYYVQAFNNAGPANSNSAQEDGCIY